MSQYAFTKLFSSITKSTVWCEPHTTVRVWITFLADCDPQGHVHASIPGLANLARVTVEECETALATFLGPDPYSRTADFEGRRIEVIDGGWKLLNYDLYRGRRDDGARREQNRESQQRRRDRQQASAEVLTDADDPQESAQDRSQKSEVKDKEEQKEQVRARGSRLPQEWQPSDEELEWARAKRVDLDVQEEADKFRDYWQSRAGKDAVRVDWSKVWQNWIRNARAPNTGTPIRESLTEKSARQNRELDQQEQRHVRLLR